MKETLKSMKEMLIGQTQAQIANLQCADYEELGAAVDMIKDLEEALYYCTIIEAMEGKDKEEQPPIERNNTYYYTENICQCKTDIIEIWIVCKVVCIIMEAAIAVEAEILPLLLAQVLILVPVILQAADE